MKNSQNEQHVQLDAESQPNYGLKHIKVLNISQIIRRKGVADTQEFFDEINCFTKSDEKLQFALALIDELQDDCQLEANAIKKYMIRLGYKLEPINFINNWMDPSENNYVIKSPSITLSRVPMNGCAAAFVRNRLVDEIVQKNEDDISFLVIRNGIVLIECACCVFVDRICNGIEPPVTFIYHTEDKILICSALRTAIRYLLIIRRVFCAPKLSLLMDDFTKEACSNLDIHFDECDNYMNMYVNLTLTQTEIWSHIRKSYRSLINMHRNIKPIDIIDKNNIPTEFWEFIKNKHLQPWTIEHQLFMMSIGGGRLHLYYKESGCIQAAIGITDIINTTNFHSAHYNMGLFDKSEKCHYALFNTIAYLKESNYHRLYLGVCCNQRASSVDVSPKNFLSLAMQQMLISMLFAIRIGLCARAASDQVA